LPMFPADELALLRAGSLLDRMSGPACDILLGSTGSGEVLVELARTTALVARIDRTGTRYRVHGLLRDALAATLPAEGRRARRKLPARASRACEREEDAHGAVLHAWCAAERDRAADLLWCAMPGSLGTSRAVDFASLLGLWTEDEIAENPTLCCSA